MSADTEVWTRDASWHTHPDTSSVKRLHRSDPTEHGMAACAPGRIMLDVDTRPQRAGDVAESALCRRCFPHGVS